MSNLVRLDIASAMSYYYNITDKQFYCKKNGDSTKPIELSDIDMKELYALLHNIFKNGVDVTKRSETDNVSKCVTDIGYII